MRLRLSESVAAHLHRASTEAHLHRASVEAATDDSAQAYADWRREPRSEIENPWPLT